jgi:glyoxylase-like metal-dependent hydrolase (beta-lactamase superfamily II)
MLRGVREQISTTLAALAVIALLACSAREAAAPPPPLAPGATWFDDWYAVTKLDERSFAIAEPRYDQHNVNYLLVGDTRALLFDTGPGVRDIRPVVAALTDRPVTAAFSHLHYDHIAGQPDFESIASLDHPSIRSRVASDGHFTPSLLQHGATGRPTFRITEWWAPDARINLGGRVLQVLPVPGHTPESLALYDAERAQLFSGDYLYPGDLFAFGPGSDLVAYRDTARRLLDLVVDRPGVAIYGAHVPTPSTSPRQGMRDLERLASALDDLLGAPAHARPWTLAWFEWIPTRRYPFDDGLVILAPLF